jgi:hypothetical protein
MVSVKDCGATGDGLTDDTNAIQQVLDAGAPEVHIPAGLYRIEKTLLIGSDTILHLDANATIRLADGAGPRAGTAGFLITNRDYTSGNRNITVEGGTWDGNNPGNPRGPDGPLDSYTGVAINFVNVSGLSLRGLCVRDPESFFIRLGEVRNFAVEEITLEAPHVRPNQDGIHIGGFCEEGTIRRIRGTGLFCPNDDMVALNADDDVARAVNLGMKTGPIRHIKVEDITAEDAYTFVRLLSQDEPVEDVYIRGIRGGCRYHALNLNRWRFPPGKGRITRVLIEDVDVVKSSPVSYEGYHEALILITLSVQDLKICNFRRPDDGHHETASLELNNGIVSQVLLEGINASQRQALEGISKDKMVFEDRKGICCLRTVVGQKGFLKLSSGGFSHLRIVSE